MMVFMGLSLSVEVWQSDAVQRACRARRASRVPSALIDRWVAQTPDAGGNSGGRAGRCRW
jgi:hypothetical protein